MSTYDDHRQHLTVPYADPVLVPKRTTHDAATESVTIQDDTKVGDTQVYGGELYRFDGFRWILIR